VLHLFRTGKDFVIILPYNRSVHCEGGIPRSVSLDGHWLPA
jgi:hypothetical protein